CLACSANPCGAARVTFPVDLLRRGEALDGVIEWSSPDFHTVRGLAFAVWIAVFVAVLAKAPRGRVTTRDLIVTIPFLVLGLWALRNVTIAPLIGLPVVARAVATPTHRRDDALRASHALAGLIVVIAVIIGVRAASQPDFAFDQYPVRAMAAVEEQGLLGRRVLTDDFAAGYVILRYSGEQRVFMDDRFDMYPLSVIRAFKTLHAGPKGWQRVLRDRDVEVVVWERDRVLSRLLHQRDDWNLVHRDAQYDVFVR